MKKAYQQLILTSLNFLIMRKMRGAGLRCFGCQNTDLRKLLFHHLEYPKDCAIYSDFQKGKEWKAMNDDEKFEAKSQYYLALLNDLEKENFSRIGIVLCQGCHDVVETYVKIGRQWQNSNIKLEEKFEEEVRQGRRQVLGVVRDGHGGGGE